MKGRSGRQSAWARGGLPMVGRAALAHYRRHVLPNKQRCGAKTKTTIDGAPCRNVALSNGKCRLHGGRTPSGSEYHKHQWPDGAAADWQTKLSRKLKQIDRDKIRQKKRSARMTPAERERLDAWRRARQPGAPTARAQRRADKARAAEMREMMNRVEEPIPISSELADLTRRANEIEAERERLLAKMQTDNNLGVFQ